MINALIIRAGIAALVTGNVSVAYSDEAPTHALVTMAAMDLSDRPQQAKPAPIASVGPLKCPQRGDGGGCQVNSRSGYGMSDSDERCQPWAGFLWARVHRSMRLRAGGWRPRVFLLASVNTSERRGNNHPGIEHCSMKPRGADRVHDPNARTWPTEMLSQPP